MIRQKAPVTGYPAEKKGNEWEKRIGWSEISITPDRKVSLYGQFAERISEYVEKPLMAAAMAVECGGDQMVLCSCDLVGVPDNTVEDVFVLPVCGPAGDQCPVDLIRWVNPETDVHDPNLIRTGPPVRKADPSMFDLAGMRKAGERVARAVIDAFGDASENGGFSFQEDISFEHRCLRMPLPLRRTTITDYEKAEQEIREYLQNREGDADFTDAAKLQPCMAS